MDEIIRFPPPNLAGGMSLETALHRRRTIRSFRDEALDMGVIGQLLWSLQGLSSSYGLRTAPSAGALFPLEVYLVTCDLIGHYHPGSHAIDNIERGDFRQAVTAAALDQEFILRAPCSFLLTAVPARTAAKYGSRSSRYIAIEIGHAAQNLLLQATVLGLGSVPIGAFDDDSMAELFRLPRDWEPLYLISVGWPSGQGL